MVRKFLSIVLTVGVLLTTMSTALATSPTTIYIQGSVWNDANNDGIYDSGETFLENVTLSLLDGSGNGVNDPATGTLYIVMTNSDGTYLFEGLAAGDYQVEISLPTDTTLVPQDQGSDDTLDSDFNVTDFVADASSLGVDDFIDDLDAGLHSTVVSGHKIEGSVWKDTDENGVNDSSEEYFPNVELSLLDGSSNPVNDASGVPYVVTTNSDGFYTFEGLAAGDYEISLTMPLNYVLSAQDQGSDDTLDSDFEVTDFVATVTSLSADIEHVDAGMYLDTTTATGFDIQGAVWKDTNKDGINDSTEEYFPNVELSLLDGSSNPVNDATGTAYVVSTNSDGFYTFENIAAGDYQIQLAMPSNYVLSAQDQGSDDTLDSDFEVTDFVATVTALSADIEHVDAGMYLDATTTTGTGFKIEGAVWEDADRDGINDSTEVYLPNITLSLVDVDGNPINDSTGTAYIVVTNSDGIYTFENVAAGDYNVKLTMPADYALSPIMVGTDTTVDSDFEDTAFVANVMSLSADVSSLDAGIYSTSEDTEVDEEVCNEVTYEMKIDFEIPETWFSDAEESDPTYEALISLANRGIVNGAGEEHVAGLDAKINRAQVSKIVSIAREDVVYLGNSCEGQTSLGDIDAARDWFYGYVKNLEDKQILSGYPDGSFRPMQKINLAETYKILAISFNLITAEEAEVQMVTDGVDWFIPYQEVVVETGIVPEWIPEDLSTEITRGTFFYLLSALIDYSAAL